MSKGALKEILISSSNDFNLIIKNMPDSEKPSLLRFLKNKLFQLEELR